MTGDYAAAASGHLEMLTWLCPQEPPCPFPGGSLAEQLAEDVAEAGHFRVLEWMITSGHGSILKIARYAASADCSKSFAILSTHHCLEALPWDHQLAIAAGNGSLRTAKHLVPVLQKHPSSNAKFTALLSAIQRVQGRKMTKEADLDVIAWLWSQFNSFSNGEEWTLSKRVSHHWSPLLVGLAARGCGPLIPRGSSAFGIAVCKGSKQLLWWLLHECESADSKQVPPGCSPGRTLLLVHGHGRETYSLAGTEKRLLAFYGSAHRSRLLQRSAANLGTLPDELLKRIAKHCRA